MILSWPAAARNPGGAGLCESGPAGGPDGLAAAAVFVVRGHVPMPSQGLIVL